MMVCLFEHVADVSFASSSAARMVEMTFNHECQRSILNATASGWVPSIPLQRGLGKLPEIVPDDPSLDETDVSSDGGLDGAETESVTSSVPSSDEESWCSQDQAGP